MSLRDRLIQSGKLVEESSTNQPTEAEAAVAAREAQIENDKAIKGGDRATALRGWGRRYQAGTTDEDMSEAEKKIWRIRISNIKRLI